MTVEPALACLRECSNGYSETCYSKNCRSNWWPTPFCVPEYWQEQDSQQAPRLLSRCRRYRKTWLSWSCSFSLCLRPRRQWYPPWQTCCQQRYPRHRRSCSFSNDSFWLCSYLRSQRCRSWRSYLHRRYPLRRPISWNGSFSSRSLCPLYSLLSCLPPRRSSSLTSSSWQGLPNRQEPRYRHSPSPSSSISTSESSWSRRSRPRYSARRRPQPSFCSSFWWRCYYCRSGPSNPLAALHASPHCRKSATSPQPAAKPLPCSISSVLPPSASVCLWAGHTRS